MYLIDVEDGGTRQIAEMVRGRPSLSPGGEYVTWWDGFETAWFAVDVESGEKTNLTENLDQPVELL